MTKLSTWAAVSFFLAFCAFSVKVKRDVAQAEALDSFRGGISYGASPPEFTLADRDGTMVELSREIENNQLVLINFWATWCPPCRLEMPLFDKMHERYAKDGLRVLAINVGEDEATVRSYLAEHPVDFTVLMDEDHTIATRYRIEAFPTTFLVDGDGKVVDVIEGLDPYLRYRVESYLEHEKGKEEEP